MPTYDPDEWEFTENSLEGRPQEEHGIIGELGAGLGRGALRVLGTPAYLADVAGEAVGWEGLEKAGEAGAEEIEQFIEESPSLRKSASISGDIRDNPQLWTDPRWYASLIGEGAPTIASMIIPGMAAAKVARVAGWGAKGIAAARTTGALGAGMGLEAGGAAEDIRQHEERTGEAVPIGKKLQTVMGTGVVAGSLEAVPVFNLFGGKVAKNLIGRIITSMAFEGGTEGAQEIVANAFAKAGYDYDRDMVGGVIESVVGGVLLGGGMGAMQETFQDRIKNTDTDEVARLLEQAERETGTPPTALQTIDQAFDSGQLSPEEAEGHIQAAYEEGQLSIEDVELLQDAHGLNLNAIIAQDVAAKVDEEVAPVLPETAKDVLTEGEGVTAKDLLKSPEERQAEIERLAAIEKRQEEYGELPSAFVRLPDGHIIQKEFYDKAITEEERAARINEAETFLKENPEMVNLVQDLTIPETVPEAGEQGMLPPGQGFTVKPVTKLRKAPEPKPSEPDVSYKPILSKGKLPFKTMGAANAAMKGRGLSPTEHTIIEHEGGFAIQRFGRKLKAAPAPKTKAIPEPKVEPYTLSRADYLKGKETHKGASLAHKLSAQRAIAKGQITEHLDYPEFSVLEKPQVKTELPDLTESIPAMAFGKHATPEQLEALAARREVGMEQVTKLMVEKKYEEASKAGLAPQLDLEAIEAAEYLKENPDVDAKVEKYLAKEKGESVKPVIPVTPKLKPKEAVAEDFEGKGIVEGGTKDELTFGDLNKEVAKYRGTGGISTEAKANKFKPAFKDQETGKIYPSTTESGKPAGVHLLEGLPEDVVTTRHEDGEIDGVKDSIISGFIKDGKFFTRDEAVKSQQVEGKGIVKPTPEPKTGVQNYEKGKTKLPTDKNWIAVELKTGDVVYDEKLPTHAQLITKEGIRAAEVKSAGWVTPEGYTVSDSDAAKTAKRVKEAGKAKPTVAKKETVDIKTRISNAYEKISKGEWAKRVHIGELRKELSDFDQTEVDAALKEMMSDEQVQLNPADDSRDLTVADRESAIEVGDAPAYFVHMPRAVESQVKVEYTSAEKLTKEGFKQWDTTQGYETDEDAKTFLEIHQRRQPKVEFRLSRYGDGTLTVWGKPQVKVEEKKASKVAKVDKPNLNFKIRTKAFIAKDIAKAEADLKANPSKAKETLKTFDKTERKSSENAQEAIDRVDGEIEKMRRVLECI